MRVGRGAPTEFTYSVTALSVQFHTAINADTTVKRMLFVSSNRRADFTLATTNVLKAQDYVNLFIEKCALGHKLCVWLLGKTLIKAVECCKRCSCIAGLQKENTQIDNKSPKQNVKKYSSLMCMFFVFLKTCCHSHTV